MSQAMDLTGFYNFRLPLSHNTFHKISRALIGRYRPITAKDAAASWAPWVTGSPVVPWQR
jgi:hypothetical protein